MEWLEFGHGSLMMELKHSGVNLDDFRFKKTLDEGILEPEVYHMDASKSDTQLFRTLAKLTPSQWSSYVGYAFKVSIQYIGGLIHRRDSSTYSVQI